MLFGNKGLFAIEANVSSENLYGELILWFGGKRFGDGEPNYFKPQLSALKRLKDLSYISSLNPRGLMPNVLLKSILDSETLYDLTLLGLNNGFDSYVHRAYKYNLEVVFLWVLLPNRSADIDFNKDVVELACIESVEYDKVIGELQEWIEGGGL